MHVADIYDHGTSVGIVSDYWHILTISTSCVAGQ